jgi:hypothetical protein
VSHTGRPRLHPGRLVKPTGRVLFSNLLRRVRLDGQILHVEDDHGTALHVGLGVGIGICAIYGVASIARLLEHSGPPRPGELSAAETILHATLAIAAATAAAVALVRLRRRPMVTVLARADGRNASSWLLGLRLPDRMLVLGTMLDSRGRVPRALLSFAHELHRLGFAPPAMALLDAVAGQGAADGK